MRGENDRSKEQAGRAQSVLDQGALEWPWPALPMSRGYLAAGPPVRIMKYGMQGPPR